MCLLYVFWIWTMWLLYDVIDRKRGDSVTLRERRTFYLPVIATYRVPVSACCHLSNQLRLTNSCFAWILWSNLPQSYATQTFSKTSMTNRDLTENNGIWAQTWLPDYYKTMFGGVLLHSSKTNQAICQVGYQYIPVSIHRKWVYQYSSKALNKLHFKEVCVRFQIHFVLIPEIPYSRKVTRR